MLKFILEQAVKAQRRNIGIALLYYFFNLAAMWRWEANTTPWPLYP
jgi:hypothetical protein